MNHLVPAVLLLFPVALFFLHDVLINAKEEKDAIKIVEPEEKIDLTPRIALRMQDNGKPEDPSDPTAHGYPRKVDPRGDLGATMRFGLIMTQEVMADPRNPQGKDYKRLTYTKRGLTNNTVVRVDQGDHIFGQIPGRWIERRLPLAKDSTGREPDGARSIWTLDDKVLVNQIVEVVPGQTGLLDTCLVKYVIENRDTLSHQIGLRFMLDTYIGANDGVPFAIPGVKGLCDTVYDFKTAQDVPDFIQAYEHSNLNDPGTVALVQFRVGRNIEPPERVTLGAWPDPKIGEARFGRNADRNPKNPFRQFMTMWNVPLLSMQTMRAIDANAQADSCVVMYWPARELRPGENRVVGFSYGLGAIGAAKEGKLGVSVGGSTELGGEFSITALITNPTPGQNVTLRLPDGLELIDGKPEQAVPPVPEGSTRPVSTVTWKVRSAKVGTHTIIVESGQSKASITIRIRKPEKKGIFD